MSFKRKGQAQTTQLPGTRPSPLASSILNVSTGIPSLDDVLGGGLQLGSVTVVLAPDPHAAYGDIVQRYFIAQGISSGQRVCILDDDANTLASSCMWISKSALEEADEGSTSNATDSGGIKIAWRYEKMKQFQTSIKHTESSQDSFSHPFDLTCRIPPDIVEASLTSNQLNYIPVSGRGIEDLISRLDTKLKELSEEKRMPIRVSIPDLGSPQWGDLTPTDIFRFLHFLRARARQDSTETPRICFFITLPSYISQDSWAGTGWSERLGWLSDACISLRSFSCTPAVTLFGATLNPSTADPALLAVFPSHHGLLGVHKLPALHSVVAPSDKFSELRGLASTSSSAIGGGENNLAFKCTRKRFVIETLHLDVEGGVSERRTTAPVASDVNPSKPPVQKSMPAVEISVGEGIDASPPTATVVKKKPKKSVAFRSDRPDLYDF